MNKKKFNYEKQLMWLVCLTAMVFAFPINTMAMHIMEGYLPLGHCIAWMAISLPFLAVGIRTLNKLVLEHRKALLLFAMMGAYAFVLSALKLPSVTGSSSHPTGTGLGAVLFGPSVMAVVGIIVLLFQALLLAHGGLTTLGANTFSMGIAGPFLTYGLYKILRKTKLNRVVCVGIACGMGDLFTYCITSFQLALAHPDPVGGVGGSAVKFLGIFAVTQIPLAVMEGILSSVVVMLLESYAAPELKEMGYVKEAVK